MKKVIIIILYFLFLLGFLGINCTDDQPDTTDPFESLLIGTWQGEFVPYTIPVGLTGFVSIDLKKSGTFTFDYSYLKNDTLHDSLQYIDDYGSWHCDADSLYVISSKNQGTQQTFSYGIISDSLVMTMKELGTDYFLKKSYIFSKKP